MASLPVTGGGLFFGTIFCITIICDVNVVEKHIQKGLLKHYEDMKEEH
jgi:hypothetical protein